LRLDHQSAASLAAGAGGKLGLRGSARQLVHQFQSERLGGSSQEIRESGRGDGGSSRPTRQGIANEAQPAAGQHGEPRTRSGASASDRPHRGQAHHRHSVARQRNVDAEPAPAPHWRCQGGGRRAGPERGRWITSKTPDVAHAGSESAKAGSDAAAKNDSKPAGKALVDGIIAGVGIEQSMLNSTVLNAVKTAIAAAHDRQSTDTSYLWPARTKPVRPPTPTCRPWAHGSV